MHIMVDRDDDAGDISLCGNQRFAEHIAFESLGLPDRGPSLVVTACAHVDRVTGLERAYYDFTGGGHRFLVLVLDGNEISLFANAEGTENHAIARERLSAMEASGAVNAQTWNGGISDEQFTWIEQQIRQAADADERVIVMGHYPIYPKDVHNMWDDERLVALFAAHDNVVLYMNGHNHAGNYGEVGGTHYVNFKGMVETADTTAYATLEVWEDRIEMLGKGVEVNRTLAI
jgi:3',5'-cyclic AMP phosphodiesterase CpdA